VLAQRGAAGDTGDAVPATGLGDARRRRIARDGGGQHLGVDGPGDSTGAGKPPGPEDSTSSGGKNPFQKAGALAVDAVLVRAARGRRGLTAALAEHPLIVVRGEFSIGKSSLLLRSDRYWGAGRRRRRVAST
jgi:hypothetical protein